MSERFLIRGASVEGGAIRDIRVEGTTIVEVGAGLDAAGARVIDADGLIALPGLVDLHTHLREPGYEASETILTGTRAETAPVFLTGFVTSQGLFLAQVCAASFVVSLPVLAAGFAAQDKLVQGLSMGAVK